MDIIKAVELAKNGDNTGITYLYEETYQKGYYIALKYLKNEYTAQDVLQDSYIKAFQNLNQLEDASKFEGWFGRIVATRSLNELKKNNPMLFSETENEDEGDISDTFEDDRIDTCPELAIDQQETSRLIQEMMAELSDEQRMCITMFYMEEMSVKEISETLGVSESTVKSRLNYGRTKIKDKVLELEKKGTKLYGLLPMVFFFALFKKDALACEVAVPAASSVLSGVGVAKGTATATASTTSSATAATATTAGAVKAGLTIGGITLSIKAIVAAVVAIVAIGAGAVFGLSHNNDNNVYLNPGSVYLDFYNTGTPELFIWSSGEYVDQNTGETVSYSDISCSKEPGKHFGESMSCLPIANNVPNNDWHLYAKVYDGVVYVTSDRHYINMGKDQAVIISFEGDNTPIYNYFDVDHIPNNEEVYYSDYPALSVYTVLARNNYDLSGWVDITTFCNPKISADKYESYCKEHNAEWVAKIFATEESLPTFDLEEKTEELVEEVQEESQEEVRVETQEELIQEETKPDNNGLAGRYEMAPGIDAWMILKINDDGTGTYEYGDDNGKLQPISDNTFNMVSNFDGSTYYKLSLSDNGDGTYNAVTTYIGGPNQFSEDWTLVKK